MIQKGLVLASFRPSHATGNGSDGNLDLSRLQISPLRLVLIFDLNSNLATLYWIISFFS